MPRSRAENLINKLISNKLSETELSEFLKGLADEEQQQYYSDVLERHFQNLLEENQKNEEQKTGNG